MNRAFKKDISVVVPLYNEEESLQGLCSWIARVMDQHGFTYEVLLVDDGSKDRSWAVIEELASLNSSIRGIRFNRNYGKSAALQTGFNQTVGEVVITMDADLQDSPDEIPALYAMIKDDGYDLVSGWKKVRHDPLSKTIPSLLFNFVTRKISSIELHDFNCGLKAYRGDAVKTLDVYGEMHRYIPMLAKRNGYDKIGEKVVHHQARKYGTTKFGIGRIFGFLDLVSIAFVTKFKKRPMRFFGALGTFSFLFGLAVTIWLIGDKIYKVSQQRYVREVTDQPLFFLALVAVIVGVQLFMAGFLAEMFTLDASKKNDYLIAEQTGEPERVSDLK